MPESNYTPPKVWTFDNENGGAFGGMNRPTAGARTQTELPRGEHPHQLYSLATPNGQKVTILFEELLAAGETGAEYDAWLIDIFKEEQFGSDFVAINPNSKIPAMLDVSVEPNVRLFESGSILVYLAEKFGRFLPSGGAERAEVLNWVFWQMGAAPFLGGGFGHFYHYAPEKLRYPIDRYTMEVKRQLDVLNRNLAEREFLAGAAYSIADIISWPWYGNLVLNNSYEAAEFLQVLSYEHVVRWAGQISERPAVQRGRRVNKTTGPEEEQVRERHSAADFGDA